MLVRVSRREVIEVHPANVAHCKRFVMKEMLDSAVYRHGLLERHRDLIEQEVNRWIRNKREHWDIFREEYENGPYYIILRTLARGGTWKWHFHYTKKGEPMADYSRFPFGEFTTEEIAKMATESEQLHDDEFVRACVEEIRKRKPHQDQGPENPLAKQEKPC